MRQAKGIDENLYAELDAKFENAAQNKDGYDFLKWRQDYMAEIKKVDERYGNGQIAREIEQQSDPITMHRLMRMMDGVRFTHMVNVNNTIIPMRLISVDEETLLQVECVQEVLNDPILSKIPGQYEKTYNIKKLSLATSAFVDNGLSCHPQIKNGVGSKQYKHFSEKDIKNLTYVEFAKLVEAYNDIEAEFNVDPNTIKQEEIDKLVGVLLDEKKSPDWVLDALISLDLHRARKILIEFYQVIMQLKGNIQLGSLLETTIMPSLSEQIENKNLEI